ncbi:unnamed protein product [Brassica rapa subsp. narinosa]
MCNILQIASGVSSAISRANPGTLAEIHAIYDAGVGHRFKYMFLALRASIDGFRHMRNVIIIDGAHLRGKYAGCLLTASAQNGNYQVFPIAVGIVDGENDNAWEWFLKMLLQFIPNEDNVVFISDRHSSIYKAISKVYPAEKHCACILHLKRNIQTYFKNKHLSYLVGKAAMAFQLSEFYTTFNEIKNINPTCAEYLLDIGLEHWARAHCSGNRYNLMTSNVAETWNSVLRNAREYPILHLVEYIRSKLMKWYAERHDVTQHPNLRLTPRVTSIVEENFEISGWMLVCQINAGEFDVKDKDGISYHVNLHTKSCSCFSFQTLLIPCPHAIAAAIKEKSSIESLVSDFYTIDTLVAAYAGNILPISSEVNPSIEGTEGESESIQICPPTNRRPPGRPRKSRILSTGEIRMKTPRKRHVCRRCKGVGHNKATCKGAI